MYTRRAFAGLAAAGAAAAAAAKPALQLGLIVSAGSDPEAAIRKVHSFGIPTCQVGVGAFDAGMAQRLRAALDQYHIEASSLVAGGPGPEVYDFYHGPLTIGFVPRQYREARIAQIQKTSDFARQCGVPAVQTHCGFIPENPNDPLYKEAVDALRTVGAYCKRNGQNFRCETGQETPITLFRAIHDTGLDNIGVNFDAANLILYGKANPVDALDILGPLVQGVHAKDGLYPTNPRELGKEVPIGQGKVNFPAFIKRLKEAGYRGPLTIEREISGAKQAEDIRASIAYLEKLI
ncbi:MAG TPA: sugar phosphate isomerase/epimerase family protein [Bryobacteraceae bacterium]|nr:sugar phosphate isomerase/epimerase family protein [Bryobacteraceae bacterium]